MNETTFLSTLTDFYSTLGFQHQASMGDALGILVFGLGVLIGTPWVLARKKTPPVIAELPRTTPLPKAPPANVAALPLEKPWAERLKEGLSRARQEVWGKVSTLLSGDKISPEVIEEVEELLFSADLSPALVTELIDEMKRKAGDAGTTPENLRNALYTFLKGKMDPIQNQNSGPFHWDPSNAEKTQVIMVVGVNGVGKTTTIGKLAAKLRREGRSVVVGACDTFRAAAVEQLEIWSERSGATIVKGAENSGPSGVAYAAVQKALELKANYCILDTAGRLHTKTNLMDELAKTKSVVQKLIPEGPQQTLLVIDAITGKNALRQAEEFHQKLGLTGVILTKCDGTPRAGSAFAILEALKIPIVCIGIGEKVSDLDAFQVDDYLSALLGVENVPKF